MGNAAGGRAWVGLVGGLPLLALLAGCAHRDPVDTPVAWWHQLEGGAIAQQRPPPPGVDDPYPEIGTTPAAAPIVASAELRHSVTEQLIEQRNLSARLNAHDPLPPPAAAPARLATPSPVSGPNPAQASANRSSANQSSATLDAADAPPPPSHPAAGTVAPAAPPAAPGGDPGDLALPAVVASTDAGAPVVLPAIPDAPPPPPGLPGMAMPPPPSYVPPARPHYALAQGPGELLQFAAGSDVLGPGQSGALHEVAAHRGAGSIYVHGYGEARSDAPQAQSQALTLAALRARSVVEALEKEGVPAGAIRIRADAFGRGARAGLVD